MTNPSLARDKQLFTDLKSTELNDGSLENHRTSTDIITLEFNKGNRLAYSRSDKTLCIWKRFKENVWDSLLQINTTSNKPVYCIAWDTVDELIFVTVAKDSTAQIWQLNGSNTQCKCLKTIQTPSPKNSNFIAKISPDGKYLVIASFNNTISFYDFQSKHEPVFLFQYTFNENVYDLQWDSKSRFLLFTLSNGTAPIYSITKDSGGLRFSLLQTLSGHNASVTSVAITGDRIILGTNEGIVSIWDLSTLVCISVDSSIDVPVTSVQASYDGDYLLITYEHHNARIIRLSPFSKDSETILELENSSRGIYSAKFSSTRLALAYTGMNNNCVVLGRKEHSKRRYRGS